MKLICDKKMTDCNCCPHSIPHEINDDCNCDCPDVKDCNCVPEIKEVRKRKLKKIYETR
jgi:hypothetical protein